MDTLNTHSMFVGTSTQTREHVVIPDPIYIPGINHLACFPRGEHDFIIRIISFDIMICRDELILKNINSNQKF